MEKEEIIELGKNLGLIYLPERDNSPKYVVFSGCEQQTFIFYVNESYKYTLLKMGEALIDFGERKRMNKILDAISKA